MITSCRSSPRTSHRHASAVIARAAGILVLTAALTACASVPSSTLSKPRTAKERAAKELLKAQDQEPGVVLIETFRDDSNRPLAVTGFVIGPDLVITAHHCLDTSRDAVVNLGRAGLAPITEVVAADELQDFIVIRTAPGVALTTPFELAQTLPKPGVPVTILARESDGRIKRSSGLVTEYSHDFGLIDRLNTNAVTAPGFSGGVALDDQRRCIGVAVGGGSNPKEQDQTALAPAPLISAAIASAKAEPWSVWTRSRLSLPSAAALNEKIKMRNSGLVGDNAGALEHARRFAELDPGNFQAHWGLIGMLLYADDRNGAAQALEAWKRNGAHPELIELFNAYIVDTEAHPDETINHLRASIRIRPTTEAYIGLSDIYVDKGDIPAATAAWNEAMAVDPDAYLPVYRLGSQAFRESRYADAAAYFEKVSRLKLAEELRGYWAQSLLNAGRRDEAIAVMQQSMLYFPRSAKTAWLLSETLFSMGRAQEAEDLAARSLEETPRDPGAIKAMSGIYARTKRPQQAMDLLRRGVRDNPTDADLVGSLIRSYVIARREDEARALLPRLRELDPVLASRYEAYLDRMSPIAKETPADPPSQPSTKSP